MLIYRSYNKTLYERGIIFLSSPNFPPRMENRRHLRTTHLFNKHQDIRTGNKFLPKTSCTKELKRGKKQSSSNLKSVSQHAFKKLQDSSNARLGEQPKLKKKKLPAQVARDCARQKAYWKNVKVVRQGRELRCTHPAARNKDHHSSQSTGSCGQPAREFWLLGSCPEVIKLFSCPTELSMKFKL